MNASLVPEVGGGTMIEIGVAGSCGSISAHNLNFVSLTALKICYFVKETFGPLIEFEIVIPSNPI